MIELVTQGTIEGLQMSGHFFVEHRMEISVSANFDQPLFRPFVQCMVEWKGAESLPLNYHG